MISCFKKLNHEVFMHVLEVDKLEKFWYRNKGGAGAGPDLPLISPALFRNLVLCLFFGNKSQELYNAPNGSMCFKNLVYFNTITMLGLGLGLLYFSNCYVLVKEAVGGRQE